MSVVEPVRKPEGWFRSHQGSSVAGALKACACWRSLCLRCTRTHIIRVSCGDHAHDMLASHGLIPLVIVEAPHYLSLTRHPPGYPLDEAADAHHELRNNPWKTLAECLPYYA
eukprot:scaffold92786_cov17-Prasinocladus_malaysianus.AAC.1